MWLFIEIRAYISRSIFLTGTKPVMIVTFHNRIGFPEESRNRKKLVYNVNRVIRNTRDQSVALQWYYKSIRPYKIATALVATHLQTKIEL